jgi:hypothetical protein
MIIIITIITIIGIIIVIKKIVIIIIIVRITTAITATITTIIIIIIIIIIILIMIIIIIITINVITKAKHLQFGIADNPNCKIFFATINFQLSSEKDSSIVRTPQPPAPATFINILYNLQANVYWMRGAF